jgi:hypothetical protein
MAGEISGALGDNYIINFLANVEGIKNADYHLKQMQHSLRNLEAFGKDIRITGLSRVAQDANGAVSAVVRLENALTRVKATATITTTPQGAMMGIQGMHYSEKAGQWYKQGQRGAVSVPQEFRGGPIKLDESSNISKVSIAHDKAAEAVEKHKNALMKLTGRAILTIPIWMALRGAFQTGMAAISDTVKTYFDLESEMGRVATVTRGSKEDIEDLKDEVISYSMTASRGFKEAASAIYALGSAGLDVKEQLAGMNHIMDLSIGTFGNTEQIAKLVAGAYNVFGDSIEGATTSSEKFKHISDILAYTYSTQQVELSEIANAMTYVASVANLVNISFDDLVTTIGVLNTGMLKGCVDTKTEILTDKGWKYFKDLDKTEKVATLNINTKELEYQFPTRYIDYKYSGKMLHQKNKRMDFLFTPNHRILSKPGGKDSNLEYRFTLAKDIYNTKNTYIRGAKWKGKSKKTFTLESVDLYYGGYSTPSGNLKINMDDWLEFLGWYLSEGCCTKDGHNKKNKTSYRTIIYQEDEKYREEIKSLLKRLNFKFWENNKKTLFRIKCGKRLAEYLKQFGLSHEKFVPDFIKQLSPRQIKIFISAYNKGDCRKEKRNTYEITTNSIRIRDDLMELALKAGYSSTYSKYTGKGSFKQNHDIWKIYIGKNIETCFDQISNIKGEKYTNKKTSTIEEWVDYNDQVYCVEVPNSIIFIRRNGKTIWTGNSKSGTALMNSFVQLASKGDKLSDLGIGFDPSKPLDFMNIMEQLHTKYGDQALSLNNLREIMDTFGRRGGRAAAQLITDFSRWQESIGDAKAKFKDFAEYMKTQAGDTLPKAWAKYWNSVKAGFVESIGGQEWLVKTLNDNVTTNTARRYLKKYDEIIPQNLTNATSTKDYLNQNENLVNIIEKNKEVYDLILKTKNATEGQNKNLDYTRSVSELISSIAKDISEKGEENVDVIKRINAVIKSDEILSQTIGENRINVYRALLKLLKDEGKIQKENKKIADEISQATLDDFETLKKKERIKLIEASGMKEEIVILEKQKILVAEINKFIEQRNLSQEDKVRSLDISEIANSERYLELVEKVNGAKDKLNELRELSLDLSSQELQSAKEYSDIMKDSFSEGLSGYIMGENSFGDIFKNMGTAMKQGLSDTLSEGIGDILFDSLGAGGAFSGLATTLKDALGGKGMKGLFNFHITGMREVLTSHLNGLSGVSSGTEVGGLWGSGAGQLASSFLNAPLFGTGTGEITTGGMGRFNAQAQSRGLSGAKKTGGVTGGGILSSAMLGYGLAQSSGGDALGTIGGSMAGIGALGVMSGIGMAGVGAAYSGAIAGGSSMMGGISAGLAAIGPLGWIAIGLLAIGSAIAMSSSGSTTTQTETKEEIKNISSRIDISNNHLEWVNRNLVALRQELTYILPQSAYFSENIEDAFALSATRGDQ